MKNEYEVRGDLTAVIIDSPKYGRMETTVDTRELERVQEFPNTWYAKLDKRNNLFYVHGHIGIGFGKQKTVCLHRWISKAPKGLVVDHINHDSLDNRRSNIRVVTQKINNNNRRDGKRDYSNSFSRGYICWHKTRMKWQAMIKLEGKYKQIGRYKTKEEALNALEEEKNKYTPYSLETLSS